MVTYMRSNEKFTSELIDIGNCLGNIFKDFKCIVFCDDKFDTSNINFDIQFVIKSGTKYSRLLYLLENDSSEYYISIDNDITGNLEKIQEFVQTIVKNNIDVAWGIIQAKPQKELISNLIIVDKIISHYYIRPILWKYNIGISIPGQLFVIKTDSFRGKLKRIDTFLDDLALGVYVNLNAKNLEILRSKEILGLEIPNSTFKGLLSQRERWADGYFSIFNNISSRDEDKLIKIHGLAYHMSWLLNYFNIYMLYQLNSIFSIVYITLISFFITRFNIKLLPYGLLYQLIFPFFHLRWLFCFIKKLIHKK